MHLIIQQDSVCFSVWYEWIWLLQNILNLAFSSKWTPNSIKCFHKSHTYLFWEVIEFCFVFTEFLQPYKPRPETSAITARRMVTGALGLTPRISKQKRDQERQQLKEARGKFIYFFRHFSGYFTKSKFNQLIKQMIGCLVNYLVI